MTGNDAKTRINRSVRCSPHDTAKHAERRSFGRSQGSGLAPSPTGALSENHIPT